MATCVDNSPFTDQHVMTMSPPGWLFYDFDNGVLLVLLLLFSLFSSNFINLINSCLHFNIVVLLYYKMNKIWFQTYSYHHFMLARTSQIKSLERNSTCVALKYSTQPVGSKQIPVYDLGQVLLFTLTIGINVWLELIKSKEFCPWVDCANSADSKLYKIKIQLFTAPWCHNNLQMVKIKVILIGQ